MSDELTEQALARAKQIIGETRLPTINKVMALTWAMRKVGVDSGYIFRDPDIFEWVSNNPKEIFDAFKQLDKEKQNGI